MLAFSQFQSTSDSDHYTKLMVLILKLSRIRMSWSYLSQFMVMLATIVQVKFML